MGLRVLALGLLRVEVRMKLAADFCSSARPGTPPGDRATYCGHDGAREIHLYFPYADANAIRLRTAAATTSQNLHVSQLFAIPGGWGWTVCRECRSLERARPIGSRRSA
jgi:hypothetical protein